MKTTKLILSVAITIGLFEGISSVEAAKITGAISFLGNVNLDTPSAGTATKVTAWTGLGAGGNPQASLSSLSAAVITPGAATIFVAPWFFASGPVSTFWSVSGYTFDLTSSSIVSQTPGFVSVSGSGVLKYTGYENTPGSWTFTTQDPSVGAGAHFSFSSSSGAVPDVGGTASLMGMGLIGLALVRRKVQAMSLG